MARGTSPRAKGRYGLAAGQPPGDDDKPPARQRATANARRACEGPRGVGSPARGAPEGGLCRRGGTW